jgi:hypothetical protein
MLIKVDTVMVVPIEGLCMIVRSEGISQLSENVRPRLVIKSGITKPHELFTVTSKLAGQPVIVGASVSLGVTSNVHVVALPWASVAVIVTTAGPVITVPAAGNCVKMILPEGVQLSVATIARVDI